MKLETRRKCRLMIPLGVINQTLIMYGNDSVLTLLSELCPKTTSTIENIRVDWTTYRNLKIWFANNK